MPRYFADTTLAKLKEKVEALWEKYDNEPVDFVNHFLKDIKVSFDLENCDLGNDEYSFGPKGLVGYNTLPNGMSFYGFVAGGDWEYPVLTIIYDSGNGLRAYVPSDGNPWNKTTKQAYGNNKVADAKDAKKVYGVDCDGEPDNFEFETSLIIADIQKRILPKQDKNIVSLEHKIKSLVYYGDCDEGTELFHEACHFCYKLNGFAMYKEAEFVYNIAKELAKGSETDAEPDSNTIKGIWG